MKNTTNKKGCVDEDCPQEETIVYGYQVKVTIDEFIDEFKRDLPTVWLNRFDFDKLIQEDDSWCLQKWYLPVKLNGCQKYPSWCSVSQLEEFASLFKGKKYICWSESQWRRNGYDCCASLIRGRIKVRFYWDRQSQ